MIVLNSLSSNWFYSLFSLLSALSALHKLAETVEKNHAKLQTTMTRKDIENQKRFEQVEQAMVKSEANFAKVTDVRGKEEDANGELDDE